MGEPGDVDAVLSEDDSSWSLDRPECMVAESGGAEEEDIPRLFDGEATAVAAPPPKRPREGGCRGPMWILPPAPGGVQLAKLVVEAFRAEGKVALEFCRACAEPVSRCSMLHTYLITTASVRRCPYGPAAVVAGIARYTRAPVPPALAEAILSQHQESGGVRILIGANPDTVRVDSCCREDLEAILKDGAVRSVAGRLSGSGDIIQWMVDTASGRPARGKALWCDLAKQTAWGSQEGSIFAAPAAVTRDECPELKDDEPAGNVLRLADDDEEGSEFSWEGQPDDAAQPPQLPFVQSEDSEEDSTAAVAVCAACLCIRGTSGCYGFLIRNQDLPLVRNALKRMQIRCGMEWILGGFLGGADNTMKRFKPCTPTWAIAAARDHQRKALDAIFPEAGGVPRCRSGVVSLPCGAGKTMVGVLASACLGGPCLVLCTNGVSVEQWATQYAKWAELHIAAGRVAKYSGKVKDKIDESTQIVLTTYHMLMPRRRSLEAEAVVKTLMRRTWAMVVMDEVHVLPADSCTAVLSLLNSKALLGLTATLVREDNRIVTLDHLIGPRLYEAEWGDLVRAGVLATVRCIEVKCAVPGEFASEYLKATKATALQSIIASLNPYKVQAVVDIVRHHEARGDKTLIFSDSLFVLTTLSKILGRPAVSGATQLTERMKLFNDLQGGRRLNTLLISRIGDCAIDLPAVSVIVQVSSHFGSRRQEAQRLGRILRPKGSLVVPAPLTRTLAEEGMKAEQTEVGEYANALFYTLVSCDTTEVVYSAKRHEFLEDQGYAYRVVRYDGMTNEVLSSREHRISLLARILSHWHTAKGKDDEAERRAVAMELQEDGPAPSPAPTRSPSPVPVIPPPPPPTTRRRLPLSALSLADGDDMVYGEWMLESNTPVP